MNWFRGLRVRGRWLTVGAYVRACVWIAGADRGHGMNRIVGGAAQN